ncbi:hypothetical protein PHLCEN_2v8101 [Hermanssonia centrifuga]|uniref:Uncharacterized protein n=1 Tax=Hermanssonia centrifuga TaxID=98765 RepID=A0A2R6NUM3_9APHY|nr:hypothetical protein PHLCEN_2v8101 [Hermanssonia centrifuga]
MEYGSSKKLGEDWRIVLVAIEENLENEMRQEVGVDVQCHVAGGCRVYVEVNTGDSRSPRVMNEVSGAGEGTDEDVKRLAKMSILDGVCKECKTGTAGKHDLDSLLS